MSASLTVKRLACRALTHLSSPRPQSFTICHYRSFGPLWLSWSSRAKRRCSRCQVVKAGRRVRESSSLDGLLRNLRGWERAIEDLDSVVSRRCLVWLALFPVYEAGVLCASGLDECTSCASGGSRYVCRGSRDLRQSTEPTDTLALSCISSPSSSGSHYRPPIPPRLPSFQPPVPIRYREADPDSLSASSSYAVAAHPPQLGRSSSLLDPPSYHRP